MNVPEGNRVTDANSQSPDAYDEDVNAPRSAEVPGLWLLPLLSDPLGRLLFRDQFPGSPGLLARDQDLRSAQH